MPTRRIPNDFWLVGSEYAELRGRRDVGSFVGFLFYQTRATTASLQAAVRKLRGQETITAIPSRESLDMFEVLEVSIPRRGRIFKALRDPITGRFVKR